MSFRGKATVGGIAVIAAGLAYFFQGFSLDMGTQSRDASSESANQNTETANQNTETAEKTSLADLERRLDQASTSPSNIPQLPRKDNPPLLVTPLPNTSQLLSIIVEERHYLWATNENPGEPVQRIELAEIVERAKQTQGTEQGIRVRIFHVGSALPSAETELLTSLKNAGLSENEIYFEQRVITLPETTSETTPKTASEVKPE